MRALALATVVFTMLALVLPLVLALGAGHPQLKLSQLLPLLVIVHASGRLASIAKEGAPRFMSLTFWLFVYAFLGVTPLLQSLVDRYSLAGSYSPGQYLAGMGIVLLGLWAYETGQLRAKSRVDRSGSPGTLKHILDRRLAPGRIGAMVLLGFATLGCALALIGPIEYLLSTRTELFEILAALPGPGQVAFQLANSAVRVPIVVAAIGMLALVVLRRDRSETSVARPGAPMLLAAAIVLLVAVAGNNPINSPRFFVGSMILSLLFVLSMSAWKRAYGAVFVVVMAASLLLLFPMLDAYRYSLEEPQVYTLSWEAIVSNVTAKGDFDAFQQLLNVIAFAESEGFTWGHQFLGALLFFVPRTLWPSKPDATGPLVGEWFGYGFTNLSCPLWGEIYMDFGVPGVMVLFALYGRVVAALELGIHSDGRRISSRFSIILVSYLAAYQVFFLRGSLMPALAYLVPFLIGFWFISKRVKAVE